jgi:hypothetical protein
MGNGVIFWEKSGRGLKLATHFHLVLRLRINVSIHLLPPYAFMAWIEKTSTFFAVRPNFLMIFTIN